MTVTTALGACGMSAGPFGPSGVGDWTRTVEVEGLPTHRRSGMFSDRGGQ